MKPLRISSSGLRGFVGSTLSPVVVMDYAGAFGSYLEGQPVLVGRDTRYSSPMVARAVKASLMSAGCQVLDFGVCPTPVLQHAVSLRGAAGAVAVSGGHNGMGWNAVNLIAADGAFLDPIAGETALDLFHARDLRRCDWEGIGDDVPVSGFFDAYLDALEQHVNGEAIRKAGYTVVIDPVGGAGSPFIKPFANRFRLKMVGIHADPSGYLAREPEPRPRSAQHIASVMDHVDGDVGFVHSSDFGRMSLVSETGEPASEEYTFAVIARHVLKKRPGPVVTNCCTSRMIDVVAARYGVRLKKTRVGQANILASVIDEDAVLAGEGSGSVALPSFSNGYDGFLMMALVLEAMAENKAPLSGLLKKLPKLHILKRRWSCDSRKAYHAVDAVRQSLMAAHTSVLDLTDGVRIDWSDGWVHVRPSQTEQLIRVISEAETEARAAEQAEHMTRLVEDAM